MSATEAPAKPKCSALNKQGKPCRAPRANGTELCAGHLGLGIASNPSAYAKAGNEASLEIRQARAEAKKLGFMDALQAKLARDADALAEQWIREGHRDYRATEAALTRLYGKPKETLEVSGGVDLTALTAQDRAELARRTLAADSALLDGLPAEYQAKLLELTRGI